MLANTIDTHGKINTFGISPKNDTVEIEDPILEIHLSEMQNLVKDAANLFNQIAELVRDAGILRGRDFARMLDKAKAGIDATNSPTERILVIDAYIRQLLTRIRFALKNHLSKGPKVIQVLTKIQAHAIQIIDYVKNITQDNSERRTEIALDSQQARILFSGAAGEQVSRKETIRAMKRAEALWPALRCGHRPNDGRQTIRLTAKVEDLHDVPITSYRDLWQRSDRRAGLSL